MYIFMGSGKKRRFGISADIKKTNRDGYIRK